MKISFKDFKKNLEKQQEQQKVIDLLNAQIVTLKARRDEYAEKAKAELKKGNKAQYSAYVSLLKYSIFNVQQTESMLANFTIAKEMCEMQTLSRGFTKALDSVMKDVARVSEAINTSKTQKIFQDAVEKSNKASIDLREVLKSNNATFVDAVNDLSEITDEEVQKILGADVQADEKKVDDVISGLEAEFLNTENKNS